MIAWAISIAKSSRIFDYIIVSTDDQEVASIARKYGAQTPFIRPLSLSDDHTGTVPVISHAITEINNQKLFPDYVCCIYPWTPFLHTSDLSESLQLLKSTNSEFVYPVVEYPHPIFRSMRRTKDGRMEFIFPDNELTRTQDLEQTYHDAGQFYWGKSSAWLTMKRMHSDGISIVIPSWRTVDIDTNDDWKRAELLFNSVNKA